MRRLFEERFWEKVDKGNEDGCWVWTASLTSTGYGKISKNGKLTPAHRVSYEMFKGPIEDGMVIDHLCRNRRCVNPSHLEQVTQRINLLRGKGMSAVNVNKTNCPQGHEYTEENTYISKAGSRYCKKCRAIYSNRSYWRKKAREGRVS